ncbi:MAG: hypothetical protein K2V38_24580, partial [Gemmataceae bacterium]|nr:hypothetical protein [Gemmataceae bacterium]
PVLPIGASLGAAVEADRIRRAVESLGDDHALKDATRELAARGVSAVPYLLEAMERRGPVVRRRASDMLTFIVKPRAALDYDPDAPTETRLRQVAHLRRLLAAGVRG